MSDLPRLKVNDDGVLMGSAAGLYLRELDAYLAEKFAEIEWYRAWHRGWTRSDDYSFWLGANG